MIADYEIWLADCGISWFVAKSERSVGHLGTHYLWWASEVGAVLWDWAPNIRGLLYLQVASVWIK